MASITLKNISKSFANNQVIKNVDLEINDGEFVVFVGPSGCGKSTLLRIISGLEDLNEGNIFIDNDNVTDKIPYDRALSMVFQSYALYPHMNVFENIGFSLKTSGVKKDILSIKVLEIAKTLRLEDLLNRLPKQLSGGQKQRVAIGRAIIREPKAFLFDEPLSNLDAALRSEMRVEISKLHKKLKSNIVYVTHDQIEAMTLADKIVIMNKGKIEQFGTPDEIYNNPNNIFVAEFIGNPKMNIFKIKTEDIINNNTFKLFKKEIKFENSKFENDFYVGIRPEHLSLENISEIAVEIKIDLIENLGSEKIIYTHINGTEIRIKSTKNIRDKNITIYLPKNKLYLFDNNENRLKT